MKAPDSLQIVDLIQRDLPALAALYRQFWGEESSLQTMRATFRRLRKDSRYLFLGVRVNGELVASALGVICEELYGKCRPFMVVEDVIVDINCRRRGFGAALMRELERRASERHCCTVLLVTERKRADACRFYRSLGYSAATHCGFKKRLAATAVASSRAPL